MTKGNTEGKVIPVNLLSKNELYHAYMHFVKNGGLFVPTKEKYELEQEVFLLVRLMEETEKFPVAGKVIWVTPAGAQGGMIAGVGIQFAAQQESEILRKKIETYLAGTGQSDRGTATM